MKNRMNRNKKERITDQEKEWRWGEGITDSWNGKKRK